MVPVTTSLSLHQILLHSVIGSYTSSAEANLPQYGSPRLSTSVRESRSAVHLPVIYPLVFHSQQYVALKICTADGDPEHERYIFAKLSEGESIPNVVKLRNTFSLEGPNGVHTVLVYDVLGNPLSFIHQAGGSKYIKLLCHQITCGIAALHRRGIVHGGKYYLQIYDAGVANPIINLL